MLVLFGDPYPRSLENQSVHLCTYLSSRVYGTLRSRLCQTPGKFFFIRKICNMFLWQFFFLTTSGPTWRKHRKIATPNYGKRAIESYSEVFNKEVNILMEKLRIKNSEPFDIYYDIVRCTSITVCRKFNSIYTDVFI